MFWCVSERADLVGMCWHRQENISMASQLASEVDEEESNGIFRQKSDRRFRPVSTVHTLIFMKMVQEAVSIY